uniref:Reverse transcriptase domain-containing protein n=1 Tax=Periophthalmus magnuspinnatus TaxID=409849 RepID=A0A3B4AU94_9GOBI
MEKRYLSGPIFYKYEKKISLGKTPLSPILFNLAIEPFTQSIRYNNEIPGITVGRMENKISLTLTSLADDIVLYATEPQKFILLIIEAIETFLT